MPTKKTYHAEALPRGFQSRRIALEVLIRVNESGAYSNQALSEALKDCQMSKRDKAFVTLLVQGITRNLNFVDDIISRYSKNPLNTLPPVLLNTLRLGVFQLEFLKDTPPSAVLNTSTSLAKVCGHKGMGSYTTAVLRNYLRAKEANGGSDPGSDPNAKIATDGEPGSAPGVEFPGEAASELSTENVDITSLSKRFSLPEWLVTRWFKNFSHEEAMCLLSFSTSEPRMVIRTNDLNLTVEGLASILERAGIEFETSPIVPSCLVLNSRGRGRGNPSELPGYKEGMFSIQDDTAAFVAKVVDPKAGESLIDLCAAPGGKTLYLGELMENKGRIIAVDTRGNRLELLKSNRKRLGVMNIEIFEADGTTFEFQPQVDRILIDAPCSGTGVLNRRADLRHRRKEEDIASLATLQYNLLANAQRLLKPGGVLVYSTCAVEPEENEMVIEKFAADHPDFKFDDLTPFFPDEIAQQFNLTEKLKSGRIQILPTIYGLSGFYIARLIKDSPADEAAIT